MCHLENEGEGPTINDLIRSSPTTANFRISLGSSHNANADAFFEVNVYTNIENSFDKVRVRYL